MSVLKMKLQSIAAWEPTGAPSTSRLDTIIARTATLSLPRRRMLGLLLDASLPLPDRDCRPLYAIWVNEARGRIDAQSKLLSTLDAEIMPIHAEFAVAQRLAATLRLLGPNPGECSHPYSDPLRDIVRDTVELFGPAAGDVTIRTDIERVGMSAPRRRALVLAAHHLVATALREAFTHRSVGTISVSLHGDGPSRAMLTVADDGNDRLPERLADPDVVLSDLVAVVDGAIACRRTAFGGAEVSLLLPTQPKTEQAREGRS